MPDDPVQTVARRLRLNQTFFMRNSFDVQTHNTLCHSGLMPEYFDFVRNCYRCWSHFSLLTMHFLCRHRLFSLREILALSCVLGLLPCEAPLESCSTLSFYRCFVRMERTRRGKPGALASRAPRSTMRSSNTSSSAIDYCRTSTPSRPR